MPRRSRPTRLVNVLRIGCSRSVEASPCGQFSWPVEAVEERAEVSTVEGGGKGDEAFQQWRLRQVAEMNRVEPGIANQPLGRLARVPGGTGSASTAS
jgi:hypothetical protein